MTLPIVMELCHVVAAIVWVGGHALLVLAILPSLAGLDARIGSELATRIGRIQMLAGTATLVFGLGRVLSGQMLPTWRSVVTTPYGWSVLASTVLTIGLSIHGARIGRAFEARVEAGALMRSSCAALGVYGGVVALMVLMRFGL